MRVSTSLRNLAVIAVWLLALWPALLFAVHLGSPVTAVDLTRTANDWSVRGSLAAGILAVVLTVLWPPFLPGLRLRWVRVRERLRQDPAQLQSVLSGLQHLETAAARLDAGRLLLAAGRPAEARMQLERAVALAPELTTARFLLGRAQRRTDPAAAAMTLASVVQEEPDHAFGTAMLELAEALAAAGGTEQAVAILVRHEREHTGTRCSYLLRARLWRRLGNMPACGKDLAAAAAPPPPGQRLSLQESYCRAQARAARLTWGRFG
jgi:tetratricopeptide (TPR) repeat protein